MAHRSLAAALLATFAALTGCEREHVQTHPEAIVPRFRSASEAIAARADAAAATLDATTDAATRTLAPDATHARPTQEPAGGRCEVDEDCPGVERCFNEALEAQYSRVFHECAVARQWKAAHPLGRCFRPACTADDQCPTGQRCGQAPMVPFPDRACLRATCRWDAQCHRGSVLGHCAPYQAGRPCEQGGWSCVYPDDPCSPIDPARRCRPVDGVIAYCVPVNGRFRCVTEDPSQ